MKRLVLLIALAFAFGVGTALVAPQPFQHVAYAQQKPQKAKQQEPRTRQYCHDAVTKLLGGRAPTGGGRGFERRVQKCMDGAATF